MKNNRMTFIKLLLRSETNQNDIESRVKKKRIILFVSGH